MQKCFEIILVSYYDMQMSYWCGGHPTAAQSHIADHINSQTPAAVAPSHLADHTGGQPTVTPNRLATGVNMIL